MDEFTAPSDERPATLGPIDLDDIGPVQPHFIASIGMTVLMVAGLTSAVAALQVYVAVTINTWAWFVPGLYGVLGLVAIPVGGMVGRANYTAAVAGTGLAGAMTLVELFWVVYAVLHGFVAPLQALAFLVSGLALLIMPFTILPNKNVEEARAKLVA